MSRLYSLSCPLEDVVDVVARIRLVGVLHRKPRLLPSCKEVLVLVVGVVIIVVVIVGVSVSATARCLQVPQRASTCHTSLCRLSTSSSRLR